MIELEFEEGQLGFLYRGVFITDPTSSECGRFVKSPMKDYKLTGVQVLQMRLHNAPFQNERYSIRVSGQTMPSPAWLHSARKNTTATRPDLAQTFDRVEAERIVKAFKGLGFVQTYEVQPAPVEAL